jgi:hypothetical protein
VLSHEARHREQIWRVALLVITKKWPRVCGAFALENRSGSR